MLNWIAIWVGTYFFGLQGPFVSSPYNPALHERVGSKRVEGMNPNLIAEQRERGYASQQPEFVLRRPKVIVSE